jgi:hypothetical protein
MPGTDIRPLIVAGVLVLAQAGLLVGDATRATGASAWPAIDDAAFQVSSATAGASAVEHAHGVDFLSRTYRAETGAPMLLTIATSAEAKNIYRAGPEVPFLGTGYAIEAAPPGAARGGSGSAFIARKPGSALLVMTAYGERRGALGNGIGAWAAAVFDRLAGQPNHYYLVGLTTEIRADDAEGTRRAIRLADDIFPRIAGWYAGR